MPLEADGKPSLQEPIYRQQREESEQEYKLFLIYRDLPWDTRSLRETTAIATGVPLGAVTQIHAMIQTASAKWRWPKRVLAYDLYIQENCSERQERILLQTRSEIEHIIFKLTKKIKRIEGIVSAEELNDPEVKRDMAILESMIGKGKVGPWVLDAYRTLFGNKVKVLNPTNASLPELEWKEIGDAVVATTQKAA